MSTPSEPPPHRWYQFTLARLFLLTTLISVLVACWAGLIRSGASTPLAIYVMTMAAPLATAILLSLVHALRRFWDRER